MKNNYVYQSELVTLASTTQGGNQRKEFILREDCERCIGVCVVKKDADKFDTKLELALSDKSSDVIENTPILFWTADSINSMHNDDRFLPVNMLAKGQRTKLSINYEEAIATGGAQFQLIFLLERS